ncbi:pyrimidine/purine nucleoside phosphorylase [Natrinema gelatinilyticum]|uniref:pyrimidine/purine nucleoside phosphorylase n=1 Tax=Natrinema gelatinilyticum TaxID=2961571 RepID=UPI0020C53CE2|nr:pyrimidine/purine nucleoside phosphorylase [Natrinema gelatinilyticum]
MTDEHFEDARIGKQANIYYDGEVTSRDVETADGQRKTLGIMLPGGYTFETDDEEEIEIVAGELTVDVDGNVNSYEAGDVFTVPSDTTFGLDVETVVDYCCTYR